MAELHGAMMETTLEALVWISQHFVKYFLKRKVSMILGIPLGIASANIFYIHPDFMEYLCGTGCIPIDHFIISLILTIGKDQYSNRRRS